MDLVEILGFVSGALCVWLVARQNVWNWPIGIANNITFLILFWTAGLYADSSLQVVYVGLAVYGWWAWLRGGDRAHVTDGHPHDQGPVDGARGGRSGRAPSG